MPIGRSRVGIADLFGHRRHRVESDVGEEDDGRARLDAGPAVGGERLPVLGVRVAQADGDEDRQHDQLEDHHDRVHPGALPDADHEHDGQRGDDGERQHVEDDRDAEQVRGALEETGNPGRGPVVGRDPRRDGDAEAGDEGLEVVAPADGDGHVAHGVLDDQIPADDPGDDLAQRRVRVGVGAPRDGDHRGELGVAERREATRDPGQDERHDEGRSGAGPGGVAGRRRADRREDAGPDDGADAEQDDVEGSEGPFELVFGRRALGHDGVEALGPEEAAHDRRRIPPAVLRCRDGP